MGVAILALAWAGVSTAQTFGAHTDYATGLAPLSVAIADVNGDGRADLITADSHSDAVSVLLNNGAGFDPQVDYPGGVVHTAIVVVGDLNADGKPDLVVGGYGSNIVIIRLGNGDGTFGPYAYYDVGGPPIAVTIADLNRDGRLDLAVAKYFGGGVSVLFGFGDGTFAPRIDHGTDIQPISVAVGDLNGDGNPDLAVECGPYTTGTLSVLLGTGGGNFGGHVEYPTGISPRSVAIGDLNGDGKPDAVIADSGLCVVDVLLGNGDGTFAAKTQYPAACAGTSVAIADLDGDGIPDVVSTGWNANQISVLHGNRDGGLDAPVYYNTGVNPHAVALGDLNGDGKTDIAVADQGWDAVSVLLNTTSAPPANLNPGGDYPTGGSPSSVAVGDLNGDGKNDLAIANNGASTVSVLLGDGSGVVGPKTDFATGAAPISVAVADLNGDGKLDLAVANHGANTVSVLLGSGNGAFSMTEVSPPNLYSRTDYSTGTSPYAVAAGDLNGDSKPDLVVANQNAASVSVLLNIGAGAFGTKADIPTGTSPLAVAIGDLNRDGKPDLAVANDGSSTVSVLVGNGLGGFGARTDFITGSRPQAVAIGDLNRDGKPDLVVANHNSASISLLLGNGSGGFGARTDFSVGLAPVSVAIADLNGDGLLDVAVANSGANTMSMLPGNGAGGFGPKVDVATASGPQAIAVGSMNSDGRADAIVADVNSNSVSVLLTGAALSGGIPSYALGKSKSVQDSSGTIRITGIDTTGTGGLRTVLPDGVSALKSCVQLPNAAAFPPGAYIEISSRARGSAAGDSLGFSRMTSLGTDLDYLLTGAIAGASEKIFAVYRHGVEVYRDRRPAAPLLPMAWVPACFACGVCYNDDLGGRAFSPQAAQPLSPLMLRWMFQDTLISVRNRPSGAADTTVDGDELRILEPDPPAGNYRALAEFRVRGKSLGEIRIVSEETKTVGVGLAANPAGSAWLAPLSPNPSRGAFDVVAFRLASDDLVSFEIVDLAGRRTAWRRAEHFGAGAHVIRWAPAVRSPGMYFVKLQTGSGASVVRRWVMLR